MKERFGFQTGKKHKRNLVHDNSTTTDFGFMQPILNRRVHAQDTVNLRIAQLVRLMPMPLPTFGTIDLRTYASFVPIEDIWHPFASMMTGQAYNGVNGSYIPVRMPGATVGTLSCLALFCSNIYFAEITSGSGGHFAAADPSEANMRAYLAAFFEDMTDSSGLSSDFLDAFLPRHVVQQPDLCKFFTKSGNVGTSIWSEDPDSTHFVDFTSLDFIYQYNSGGANEKDKFIGFRLNNIGRALRKILIGSGYQLTKDNTFVEVCRIWAYYKVWFDLFQPARDLTWKDTVAFHLMEFMEQMGLYNLLDCNMEDLCNFFYGELPYCYYTQDPDFISAHIVGMRNQIVAGGTMHSLSPSGSSASISVSTSDTTHTAHMTGDLGAMSWSMFEVWKKMSALVNIESGIGNRVRELMRVLFNSDYLDEHKSNYIGSQILPIEAEGIFSMANTDSMKLGEYAGKAVSGAEGKKFKYTCKSEGFVVALMAAVPRTGYAQGIDSMLEMTDKYSTYQPAFDGKTLLPSRKNVLFDIVEFYKHGDSSSTNIDYSGGFGNIPIYSGTRYAKNILNGDMSLKSTRESFLPYTLDKLLPYPRFALDSSTGPYQVDDTKVANSLLVASSMWRYIGKYGWMGNFDRIFWNQRKTDRVGTFAREIFDDNFVVSNLIVLEIYGYPLPWADSFQTEAFDGKTMSIQKA